MGGRLSEFLPQELPAPELGGLGKGGFDGDAVSDELGEAPAPCLLVMLVRALGLLVRALGLDDGVSGWECTLFGEPWTSRSNCTFLGEASRTP